MTSPKRVQLKKTEIASTNYLGLLNTYPVNQVEYDKNNNIEKYITKPGIDEMKFTMEDNRISKVDVYYEKGEEEEKQQKHQQIHQKTPCELPYPVTYVKRNPKSKLPMALLWVVLVLVLISIRSIRL